MSETEDTKGGGAVDAVPTSASFADTLRPAGKLFALLARGGTLVKVPVNFLSANARAAIDADHPDPFPPRKFNAQGQPYLDVLDKEHRRACDAQALARLKARVAALMPDEYIGAADRTEKIRRIWAGWSEADILTYDRQGANPYETREEGVQAAEAKHAPFVRTDMGESAG